ncbi:hypothetical protein BDV12DRAFT_53698 [Aspergillus spectabilis]
MPNHYTSYGSPGSSATAILNMEQKNTPVRFGNHQQISLRPRKETTPPYNAVGLLLEKSEGEKLVADITRARFGGEFPQGVDDDFHVQVYEASQGHVRLITSFCTSI